MSRISKSPTIKHEKGTSAKSHMPVGTGSRPATSKHKLPTSAPKHPHHQGRHVKGALK